MINRDHFIENVWSDIRPEYWHLYEEQLKQLIELGLAHQFTLRTGGWWTAKLPGIHMVWNFEGCSLSVLYVS